MITPIAMRTILELDSVQPPLNVKVGETIKMDGRKYLVIGRTGWRAAVVPVTAVTFDAEGCQNIKRNVDNAKRRRANNKGIHTAPLATDL
jgi:hypothetical protein